MVRGSATLSTPHSIRHGIRPDWIVEYKRDLRLVDRRVLSGRAAYRITVDRRLDASPGLGAGAGPTNMHAQTPADK